MDYAPFDSRGTRDDFPALPQNRISRGGQISGTYDDFPAPPQNRILCDGQISGNVRPPAMGSDQYPRIYDGTDMEAKIHQLELEAYSSVIKAFKAQADAITWEKEGLITELRKELKLSTQEHKDILNRVNADEKIRIIRQWRQSSGPQPTIRSISQAIYDLVPSFASHKKQKMPPSLLSQFITGPYSPFHQQTISAANQPFSSAAKHGPSVGPIGKLRKPIPPGTSLTNGQYPSGPGGRGQFSNHMSSGGVVNKPADLASSDPFVLIGKKVQIRWPADNTFYKAVITAYNPAKGLHSLVYDIGTENETWEWVNLFEMSPEDIQWEGEDRGILHRGGYAPIRAMYLPIGQDNVLGIESGKGLPKAQRKKDFPPSGTGTGNKGPDIIRIFHTDTVIKQVEMVFGDSTASASAIEVAKKLLKDHEQALTDAISRITELYDGDNGEDR